MVYEQILGQSDIKGCRVNLYNSEDLKTLDTGI